MTITPWMIFYLITRLDGLRDCCIPLISLSSVLGVFAIVFFIISRASDDTAIIKLPLGRVAITCLLIFIMAGCIRLLTPTTKEAILIMGVPALVNSDMVQNKIPAEAKELYQLAKDYLTKENEASKK